MTEVQDPTAEPGPEIQVPPHKHPVSVDQFEALVGQKLLLETQTGGARQEVTLRKVERRRMDNMPEGMQQPFDLVLDGPAHGIQETGLYNLKTKTGQGAKLKANGVYVQCLAEVPPGEGQSWDTLTYVVSFN